MFYILTHFFQESSGCNMLIFWIWPAGAESATDVFCERCHNRWRRVCYSKHKIYKNMETSEFRLSFFMLWLNL